MAFVIYGNIEGLNVSIVLDASYVFSIGGRKVINFVTDGVVVSMGLGVNVLTFEAN